MKNVNFLPNNTEAVCVFSCLLGIECVSTAKACVSRNIESLLVVGGQLCAR